MRNSSVPCGSSTSFCLVTPGSSGGFTATFRVPLSSLNGDQTVKATQGFNSASKTFQVTALIDRVIILEPSSGPSGTSVTVSGAGFAPASTVTIDFGSTPVTTTPVTTTPFPLTTNSSGGFTATFNVPSSSLIGDQIVKATRDLNRLQKHLQ